MTPTEIKFCSRVIIFSPFYQVLVFKIRKGFFLGDPVYVCIYTYMCISINPSIYLSIYLSNLLIISVFEPGSGDSHDEEYKKIHEDYKNLVSMSTIKLKTSPLWYERGSVTSHLLRKLWHSDWPTDKQTEIRGHKEVTLSKSRSFLRPTASHLCAKVVSWLPFFAIRTKTDINRTDILAK